MILVQTILKKGELSRRSDFIEILRKTLNKYNLDVHDETIIETIGDGKDIKFLDLIILERGKYQIIGEKIAISDINAIKAVIETKNPKIASTKGINQLIKYCNLLGMKLGFTTNFKDVYKYHLTKDEEPVVQSKNCGTTPNQATYRKISKYILNSILMPPKIVPEMSDEEVVDLLQRTVDEIKVQMTILDTTKKKDPLGIFKISYDKEFFESGEVKEKVELEQLIKSAAAFLLVNQILFYMTMSKQTGLFAPLHKLNSLEELQNIFNRVAKQINYKAVFGVKVVSMLPQNSLEIVNSLIENFETLHFYKIKRDVLGKIFHGLIEFNLRKRIAAYYTSSVAASLLANLSIKDYNNTILDPACGSGTLLVASYHQKKQIAKEKNVEYPHLENIKSIYGTDISIFASHLSAIYLSIQDLASKTNKVYIAVEDAFKLKPCDSVQIIWTDKTRKLANGNEVTEDEFPINQVDVVITNPPFTRIERLEPKYKKYLIGKKGVLKIYQKYTKGQEGLHCFFIYHSTSFVKEGGRFAAVLPAATFSSNYSKYVEQFILKNYCIEYLIVYDTKSTFSEGCDFKEFLFIGKKEKPPKNYLTKVVILKKEPTLKEIPYLANRLEFITEETDSDQFELRLTSKKELESRTNWMTFVRPRALRDMIAHIEKSEYITRQDKVIKFHEGYHIDAPHFFRLPNRYWELINDGELFITIRNNEELYELNIPKKYLLPTLKTPDAHRDIKTKMKNYLLTIPPKDANRVEGDLKRFIEWGKSFKVSERKAPRFAKIKKYSNKDHPWFTYGSHVIKRRDSKTGNVIQIGGKLALIRKFRTKKRECIGLISDRTLLGGHTFYFANLSDEKSSLEKVMVAWYNSSIFLGIYLFNRREISGDYGEVRIKDLHQYPCINPYKFKTDDVNTIVNVLETLCENKRLTIYKRIKDKSIKKLDSSLLKAIGMENVDEFLDHWYEAILSELDKEEL